jgi:hypothetical protein
MKKQIIIATLISFAASCATANFSLNISLKTDDTATTNFDNAKKGFGISDLGIVTPAFQNAIHNDDLSRTDSSPLYTIRGSGRYYFAGDIIAQRSTSTDGVIIGIDANNVTLNMNSKVLMPHVSSSHTGATAIQITAGKSNVQVMNGTVQGVDSSGTQRFAKGLEVPTTGTVNYTVKLHNIHVTRLRDVSNVTRGFDINGVNDFSMENCNVNDLNIASATGAKIMRGISLDTVNNLLIKGCESNNHTAVSSDLASTVVGLYMNACVDGSVENVISTNNHADAGSASDAGTCYGVHLLGSSKNIAFSNVNTSSNKATGTATGAVAGFLIAASPVNSFTNCVSNNNSDVVTASNPTGFDVASSSDNCRFINCRAEQNNSAVASSSAHGFKVASDNNLFEGCNANGNSGAAASYGMHFNASTENRVNNCTTNYNQSSAADAYGVFMTSACQNNHFLSCESNGNIHTAASQTSAGFYSTGGTANRFEKCVANGNSASPTTLNTTVNAGFHLASSETRTQLVDCEAVGNSAGDTSSLAYGIYVESGTSCIIKNCYMAYNNVASGAAFGFADDTTASTTILINNLAVGQSKCLGGTLDSSLQWTKPTNTNQNYYWQHPGTSDDPRNVVQEAPILNYLSISTTVGDWTNISLYSSTVIELS